MIRTEAIEITTNASGGGTATTPAPLTGYVVEVRMANAGTAVAAGGTADLTFTRQTDGGTVLALTNVSAPFSYQPAPQQHTVTGGTTAYATGIGPVTQRGVPINDYLKVVVADGQVSASATIYVHVDVHLEAA